MKKILLAAVVLAASGTTANAAVGRTLTQDGYSLVNEYSIEAVSSLSGDSRGGAGYNDYFVVNENMGSLRVYGKSGLISTIALPDGYHLWTTSNTDDAGHILIRVDKVKTKFDGVPSTGGNHGFLVFDTNTGKLLDDVFIPLTQSSSIAGKRFDSTGHIQGDILNDKDVRVYMPVGNGTAANEAYTGVFIYEKGAITVNVPSPYVFASTPDAEVFAGIALANQQSTGMAMQYTEGGKLYVADFPNPHYELAYSAAGKYGNVIAQYATEANEISDSSGNKKTKLTITPTGKYFYTPARSGYSGFNIFSLAGQDFIIYPHATKGEKSGDAFAIAKLAYVESPLTDMSMPGEEIINDELSGTLVAVVRPATQNGQIKYAGNPTGACTYSIEPVEGDPNSVYIYAYGMQAPANKWKFTVSEPATEAPLYMISKKAGADWNVGAGLAGDLMTNIDGTKAHVLRDVDFPAGESLIGFSRYTGNFNSVNLDRFGPAVADTEIESGTIDLAPTFDSSYLLSTSGATTLDFVADMASGTLTVYTPADLLPGDILYMHGTFWDRHFDFSRPVEMPLENPSADQPTYTANGILLEAAEGSDKAYFILSSAKTESAPASRVADNAKTKADIEEAVAGATAIGHVYEARTAIADSQVELYPRIAGVDSNTAKIFEVEPGFYDLAASFSQDGTHTLAFQYKGTVTGIADVDATTEAPAVYYNLQGIHVENPTHGIFIKVQGGKSTKVVL